MCTGALVRRRAVSVLIAGAVLLVGCGGDDDAPSTSGSTGGQTANSAGADADSAAAEQPELRVAVGGEPDDGFDPTRGWGRYGSPLFQSTLLRLDADLNIVNDLATGYEVSDDGLTWTVTLRNEVTYSDGTPVTATDVVYTFLTAQTEPGLTDLDGLDTATATDDTTVEFVLKQPVSTFIYRLTSLGIVPEHAHDADYAQHPIGSGPYAFVQWDKGQQLIVERNETYYGDRPEFSRIVFVFTDEDGTLAAAKAGEVHLASVPGTLATGEIDGMNRVQVPSIDNRGIMFPYVPDDGETTASGAPIGDDVTSDRAIRQAINLAVDRQILVDGVLQGFGSPATGPVDGAPWYNPDSAIVDNQPDEAIATLEAGGWTDDDGDGVRERDGVSAAINLWYPAGDTVREGLALAVADQVKPIGVKILTTAGSWEEIEQHMHTDAILFGWGSHDPTEMYNIYSSTYAGVDYWNTGYYDNPAVQAHLDAALHNPDPIAANDEWKAAQLDGDGNGFTAAADAAWAWLVNLDHMYYVDQCLDLGALQTEPHGHGWPITAGITQWQWTC